MLKGKSFLKLLDFTTEELQYLLDLAKKLKIDKKNGTEKKTMVGKNIALILRKLLLERDVRLKWELMTKGRMSLTLGLLRHKLVIRSLWKILRKFWEDFMTESSIEDTVKNWSKLWLNIRECLFGMDLQLSFIQHRFWRIF